jgi:hypothetical protein
MTKEDFTRQVRRAAFLTIALVVALVFGVIVLARGDWLPGGIIVASSLIGLASHIPVVRKVCNEGPEPAPPRSEPAQLDGTPSARHPLRVEDPGKRGCPDTHESAAPALSADGASTGRWEASC